MNREDLGAALSASDKVTEITHNHPEGIKGARATTHAIYLIDAPDILDVIQEMYQF